eukprot:SM000061S19201  [mRNA]  locus=s61:73462:73969:- [translate_table: standard]
MALQHGAPLVPAFVFGQRDVYHYWRPAGAWHQRIAKAIHFAPMLFWGVLGSPVPLPRPLVVVIGRPIPMPKCDGEPSEAQVAECQERFVAAMAALYERHKAAAGSAHVPLVID